MASGQTPLRKRPIPLESDVPDVAADLTSLGDSVDKAPNIYQATSSTLPPGTTTGLCYGDICQVTDTNQWVIWSGTSWVPILVPSPWVVPTILSGVIAGSGYQSLHARQEGDIVRLKGSMVNDTGSTINAGTAWATLPAGLHPAEQQSRWILGYDPTGPTFNQYWWNITAAGAIEAAENISTSTTTVWFFDDICFTLN